jgi:hypothetical protein
MVGQGLHDSHQKALEAYSTEICESACRISRQGELGCGMLSVRKSVGKHSCPVADTPWISLFCLELRRHAGLGRRMPYRQRVSCKRTRQRRQTSACRIDPEIPLWLWDSRSPPRLTRRFPGPCGAGVRLRASRPVRRRYTAGRTTASDS